MMTTSGTGFQRLPDRATILAAMAETCGICETAFVGNTPFCVSLETGCDRLFHDTCIQSYWDARKAENPDKAVGCPICGVDYTSLRIIPLPNPPSAEATADEGRGDESKKGDEEGKVEKLKKLGRKEGEEEADGERKEGKINVKEEPEEIEEKDVKIERMDVEEEVENESEGAVQVKVEEEEEVQPDPIPLPPTYPLVVTVDRLERREEGRVNPLMCQTCGRTLRTISYKSVHRRTHDTPRFPCPAPGCGMASRYKFILKRHQYKSKH